MQKAQLSAGLFAVAMLRFFNWINALCIQYQYKIARSFYFMNSPFNPPIPPFSKGHQTRSHILEQALAIANRDGLQGLSIGMVADRCVMSKSGVFAHFGAREELQIAVVQEYHRRFEATVFTPSLQSARGLVRLKSIFANWVAEVTHEIDVGSVYISGAVEFDEQPGSVRDALVYSVSTFQAALEKAVNMAVKTNELLSNTNPAQLVFEMHALILALHHDARFLRKPNSQLRAEQGFERLLKQYQST